MSATDAELYGEEEVIAEPEAIIDGEEVIAEPEAIIDEPEKYTIKIDGEEVEVDLDELKKGYGSTKSAQNKFSEAAVARKQAEEFVRLLKSDPMALMAHPDLGLNPREIAENYLRKELDFEDLSPEQQELQIAKQRLAEIEEERKAAEELADQEEMTAMEQKYHQEFTVQINDALTKAELPITDNSIKRMAGYMQEVLLSEDPAVSALTNEDIVEFVREDLIKDFKSMFAGSSAETLTGILGSDLAKTLREDDIAKLISTGSVKKPVAVKSSKPEKAKIMGTQEWNDYLDNI